MDMTGTAGGIWMKFSIENYGSCHTLGWVLKEDDKFLTLAHTTLQTALVILDVLGYLTIPKSLVIKTKELNYDLPDLSMR